MEPSLYETIVIEQKSYCIRDAHKLFYITCQFLLVTANTSCMLIDVPAACFDHKKHFRFPCYCLLVINIYLYSFFDAGSCSKQYLFFPKMDI